MRLDGGGTPPRDQFDKYCPIAGRIELVNRQTGEAFRARCRQWVCPYCGPRHQRHLALVAHQRVLNALAAGRFGYALHFSGGRLPLAVDAASAGWQLVVRHLRRRLGLVGYLRVLQLDAGQRIGTHAHVLIALERPLGREPRSELNVIAINAGFGYARYHAIRSDHHAERVAQYATRQLVDDGRALAGSGARLATWSRSWTPRGWI